MSTGAWIEEHWIGEAVLLRSRRAPKLPALPVAHAPTCSCGNAALAAHAQSRDSARHPGDRLSARQDGRNVADQQARKLTQPVTFKWKDYRAKGEARYKLMTLDVDEFIRRFLIHVLPGRFHRIRHYGLFANANRANNIALARQLLGVPDPTPSSGERDGTENRHEDPEWNACPCCGGRMIIIETFQPGSQPRQWPTPLIGLDSS
jgi:hypothetical protein